MILRDEKAIIRRKQINDPTASDFPIKDLFLKGNTFSFSIEFQENSFKGSLLCEYSRFLL